MADAVGRKAAPLIKRLLEAPGDFELEQAVRILTLHLRGNRGPDAGDISRRLRIVPWLSLGFPETELVAARREGEDGFVLENALFGLYSTLGPLPAYYTEALFAEAHHDESVIRDFLDIVNARLSSRYFQAEPHHDLPRRYLEDGDGRVEHVLLCLMGQAYEEIRPKGGARLVVMEPLLGPRSAAGLELYLQYELGIADLEVEQCVPRRVAVPRDQRCRVGLANCVLGKNAMAGESVADVAGKIRIHLRGLDEETIRRHLPGNEGHAAVQSLMARYVEDILECDLVLHPSDPDSGDRLLGKGLRVGSYLAASGIFPLRPVTAYSVSARRPA